MKFLFSPLFFLILMALLSFRSLQSSAMHELQRPSHEQLDQAKQAFEHLRSSQCEAPFNTTEFVQNLTKEEKSLLNQTAADFNEIFQNVQRFDLFFALKQLFSQMHSQKQRALLYLQLFHILKASSKHWPAESVSLIKALLKFEETRLSLEANNNPKDTEWINGVGRNPQTAETVRQLYVVPQALMNCPTFFYELGANEVLVLQKDFISFSFLGSLEADFEDELILNAYENSRLATYLKILDEYYDSDIQSDEFISLFWAIESSQEE